MADFRKWLLALAAVAVLLCFGSSTAFAQGAFTCNTTGASPNIVRSEGVAELVGDVILNCTGGTPTKAGKEIPLSNVQVSLNTNITSRIVQASSNVSEALLLIDEPYPSANGVAPQSPTAAQQGPSASPTVPPVFGPPFVPPTYGNATTQQACLANNNTNCQIISVGVGTGSLGSYSGVTDQFTPGPHFNIFQGVQANTSTLSWQGVPIDAPGTAGIRTIRITNIRANACLLGVSSTFIPTQITAIIGVNGGATIIINNPSQVVGQAQQGLLTALHTDSYVQCDNLNPFLLESMSGPTETIGNPSGITGLNSPATAAVTEGFAYSFKPRNYNQILSGLGLAGMAGTADPDSDIGLQNIPGFTYRTESGFIPGPAVAVPGGGYVPGTGTVGTVGLATQGTEISFAFAGVQTGVSLFVPGAITLTGNYGAGTPAGFAVLIGGDGGFDLNQVTISGSTAVATYEILYSDPSVTETMSLFGAAAYISNTGQNIPAPGVATVAVNFAPLSTSPTASASAPIPRFCQPYTPANLFTINSCNCNLLFPFVTNQFGFDTGVAIANTTADTLNGVTPQQGTVTLTYYGTTTGGGAAPPTAVTTSDVASGSELVFTLSSGGNYGIPATPGFEGYIIARANFQYCHGFAFISDAGAQKLAEGYLAIQLDLPGLNRTGVPGENEGH